MDCVRLNCSCEINRIYIGNDNHLYALFPAGLIKWPLHRDLFKNTITRVLRPVRYIPRKNLALVQTFLNSDSYSPLSGDNVGDPRNRASNSHSNSEDHFRGMNGFPWKPQISSSSRDRTESTVIIRLLYACTSVSRNRGAPAVRHFEVIETIELITDHC